jgi:dienelactone hydrolase
MNHRLASKLIALKRRISIAVSGTFDPYPPAPAGVFLSPSHSHFCSYENAPLILSWKKADEVDPVVWQGQARSKLAELIGYRKSTRLPEVLFQEKPVIDDGVSITRYYIRSESGRDIPVTLVQKEAQDSPIPIMICLHGHNSGAHLSWGEMLLPADPLKLSVGADYARQATDRGFLAVCIEQECFGERREKSLSKPSPHTCFDAAHNSIMLGKTLLGERIEDISTVIDWLMDPGTETLADKSRIYTMGNSAGGDSAVFSAALDERIMGVMASGCVGRFRVATGRREACPDIIIPGILNWMEYDDIVALCAPRPLIALSGVSDHIYPFSEVEAAMEKVLEVYTSMGAGNAVRVLQGSGGHRFYPELAWPEFMALVQPSAG